MSSKLHRAGEQLDAAPIVWRRMGADPVGPARPPALSAGPVHEPGGQIAELERQIEARVTAAYQQGQSAAEAAANQRASQRLDPILTSLTHITQELAGVRKKFRADAEEDTVKLAIAIARRVIHRELATDPQAILGVVIAAFQKLNARETRRLRVSPGDAGILQQFRERLDLPPGLEIFPDSSLITGSAIFETSRGELDASVDTQLAEIDRGFADIIRKKSA